MNRSIGTVRSWDRRSLSDPHGQADKAERVRAMFDAVAPTYELVNRVASAGRDGYWRRRAVHIANVGPEDRVLDVACGSGDLAREFQAAGPRRVVGLDFAWNMLRCAATRPTENLAWCQGDALRLPFADRSFSVVSCAFGVRNFQSLATGLGEFQRVLAPGGRAVLVEFSLPDGRWARRAYRFYFERILPRIGTWISRDRTGAYWYLPRSVMTFVDEPGLVGALRRAGFVDVCARRLTFGVAVVYMARKPRA